MALLLTCPKPRERLRGSALIEARYLLKVVTVVRPCGGSACTGVGVPTIDARSQLDDCPRRDNASEMPEVTM